MLDVRAALQAFRERAALDRLHAAWLLSLGGLRRSEVLGLRWEDADLGTGRLRIERGRVAVTPTFDDVGRPTRGTRRREIPLGTLAGSVPALRELRARLASESESAGGAYRETGFVVVDEHGFPLRPAWYSGRFAALCRDADVPAVPLRSLRCTAVQFLRDCGVPPACVTDWLGQDPGAVLARCAGR